MAKFPDPTKKYTAKPIDKPIDATKLGTKKYTPPKTAPTSPPPPTSKPIFQASSTKAPPLPIQPVTNLADPTQKTGLAPQAKDKSKKPIQQSKSSPFKKLIPILLGLAVFAGLAFVIVKYALPLLGEKEPEPVTLTYWGLWEPKSVMQQAIADYQRLNPHITINYTMQSPKNYRARLQNAIQQNSAPDIARIHNTWLPMLENYLSPAPKTLVTSSDLDKYYSVVEKDFAPKGDIYALPLMIDGLILYYNEDIFSSAGLNPPTDWRELRKRAFDLTRRNPETGAIEQSGIAMGTTGNVQHWSDILGLLILQNSGDPASPNSTEVQEALSFYTIFSVQDRIWDDAQPNSIYAFATNSVAMILAPSWQAEAIRAINPDIKFKTTKSPSLAGTEIAWATYWAESVPNSSENQEEAWKFIKYLTSKEVLQKLYATESQLRGFGEPYPLVELGGLLSSDPITAPVVTQAPNYQSWYLSSDTKDEGINDNIIKYYEDAVNRINEGGSVASTLKTLSSGVQQVLARYPIN